jgi:hypothetical protein
MTAVVSGHGACSNLLPSGAPPALADIHNVTA